MPMQMQRAFSVKFLVNLTRYSTSGGYYNDDNDWVEGTTSSQPIKGRVLAGNKFSQFEEGLSVHNEDGGQRLSDFRTLYIPDKYQVSIGDTLVYSGVTYNILQESDERPFGFKSFLLEKSERRSDDSRQS